MPQTIPSQSPGWLHYFERIDSTNNYAMRLINDGMAKHGQVIWAARQSEGKGQRGNTWHDYPETLKFSLLLIPHPPLDTPFQLSMLTAITLAVYLNTLLPQSCKTEIKWPNDIYINDKKACGILIENAFRGKVWTHSTVGIGLNVHQKSFPDTLKTATSLANEEPNKSFNFLDLITDLRNGILNGLLNAGKDKNSFEEQWLRQYNNHLYRKGIQTLFEHRLTGNRFSATVLGITPEGALSLRLPSGTQHFSFGSLTWLS